jgi:CHAD domain-containing protein
MAKTKRVLKVDGAAPANDGIRVVLNNRLEEMCSLRDLALDWNDPDGVHDMRVASRRLRGALQDFLPYLRKRPLLKCLREIRAIARALGRVRDYDVAIMALEKIAADAPPDIGRGVLRFANSRCAGFEEAHLKLIQSLAPDALARLKNGFPKSLAAALGPDRRKAASTVTATNSDCTYRDLGRQIIARRLDDFEDLGKSFYRPLRVKPLHDLRIAAKHLRYALELFEQSWDQEGTITLQAVAARVAALQSSLGDLHDCDVWIENFGEAAIYDGPDLDFDKRTTSIWLLSYFVKMHGRHLSKALRQWNAWQTEGIHTHLRSTIRDIPG